MNTNININKKIYAISNQKGGVGKTTLTVNLGASLAKMGYKVCLVDCDSQANLSMSLGCKQPDELEIALPNLINEVISFDYKTGKSDLLNSKKYIIKSNFKGLDYVPSNIGLAYLENNLMNALSREMVLEEIIKIIKPNYDYILLDAPPSLGIMVINILKAADRVLIPVQPHFFSAKGIEMLFNTIESVKTKLNPKLIIDGAIITMFDSRINFQKETVKIIEESYAENFKLFKTKIPVSIKATESQAQSMNIFEYDPSGKIAEAYTNLAKELLNN